MAGYPGTPLVRKLGIKAGMTCAVIGAPPHYWDLLDGLPPDLDMVDGSDARIDFVHLFVRERKELAGRLPALRERIAPDGMIWVSWPKKASGVETDLTGAAVREAGLAAGLVDVKVCAVDGTWSGHKFVIRRADR